MIKLHLNSIYKSFDETIVIPVYKFDNEDFICIKTLSKFNTTNAQFYIYYKYGRCFGVPMFEIKKQLKSYDPERKKYKQLIKQMKDYCAKNDIKTTYKEKLYITIGEE